jgi:hypothetical protein
MKTTGAIIRKISKEENGITINPSTKNLHKQIKTLHKKIKKKDDSVTINYSIEKDNHKGKYHTHLLVKHNDETNLHNQLKRFIGGNEWTTKQVRFDKYKQCKGKFGEVDTHYIYDEQQFLNYMNKTAISEVLL